MGLSDVNGGRNSLYGHFSRKSVRARRPEREQEHSHQCAFGFMEVVGSAAQVTGLHKINKVTKEVKINGEYLVFSVAVRALGIGAYGFFNKAQFYAGFTECLKLKDGAVTAVMIPVMSRNRRCLQPISTQKLHVLVTARHSISAHNDTPPGTRLFSERLDPSNGSFNLKALSGSSGYRFGVLARIVNYMKTRHQRGDTHHLTLEEILDETKLLDIGMKQKQWLMSEALSSNPKIDVREGKYAFKPKYHLKDKKALLRLLDKHDQLGLGGVLLDDVEEGLPNAAKAIKALGDQIIFVTRPDKKKILFYNDKHCQFTVDEEFQKLWRSVPVDSIDEEKIEEYLKKQGISSMQETGPKKIVRSISHTHTDKRLHTERRTFQIGLFMHICVGVNGCCEVDVICDWMLQAPIQKRKKPGTQRKRRFKTHNDHLNGVLEDYSEGVPSKK
ncbi:General transcription factor IIE subunit 2 [Anabarilius grahami]|uniref:General transcription factor IIE subunit 2 n=1 Tax=Anabarilius grahami TaxID=495550 RepID=A0A3N0XFF5_ANAGA|nr:General transcription factor IIE subunit 2 [Anabarilius grahami]